MRPKNGIRGRGMRLAIPLAALLLLTAGGRPASANDGAAREWNQVRGSAARTGSTTLEPLLGAPRVAWEAQLKGPIVSEPVAWGGVVFAASQDKKYLQLSAFDAFSGKKLGTRKLGKGTWADLAAWQGHVISCQADVLQGVPFKNGRLGNPWKRKGDWAGAPCVYQGVVLAIDGGSVKMLDAVKGKVLAETPWLPSVLEDHPAAAYAMLAVDRLEGGEHPVVGGVFRGGKDGKLHLYTLALKELGSRSPEFGPLQWHELVKISGKPDPEAARDAILGRLSDGPGGDDDAWFFTALRTDAAGRWAGTLALPDDEPEKVKRSEIETAPASLGGRAFGFDKKGTLYAQRAEGRDRALTKKGVLPKGAQPGPACTSGSAVCFGNWAIDTATGRTLWCLPDVQPATPAVPVADGFVAYGTADGRLVCLASEEALNRATAAPATGDGETAATAPEPPPPGDGVLLVDGRKIEGTIELLKRHRIKVIPTEGEPFEVPQEDVILAVEDDETTYQGEGNAALALWQEILDARFVEVLSESFEAYRKVRLIADCRRVLADLRGYGMSPAEANALDASLAGKSENAGAKNARKRLFPEEQENRAGVCDEVLEAVEWCQDSGFPAAGAALLEHVMQERPDDPRVDEVAKGLVPDGFPWKSEADAGRQWIAWAKAIGPAGGEFVEKGSSLWDKVQNAPWNEDTILLKTRNMLLFSRSHDRNVVGMCLRNGEGTVRALEKLLGPGSTFKREIIDVRLHRNREEYLAEKTPTGSALPWSAGYYSPREKVSRFYVPDPARSVEPLGRGLGKTLSHEITHHWIDRRWMGGFGLGGSGTPGYWIVEGMARFVEDQSMEMGRRAGRMDDPTVTSLDACSQAAAKGKLQNTAEFVAMTQVAFSQMPEKHVADVRLRNTLQGRRLDTRALFYEQAGSLVYFLMNERGEAGRKLLIEYMRRYYMGRTKKNAAIDLGFDNGEQLHAEFSKFLNMLAN